jgi:signal transduction histidine kinase/CheY-like chemotaxis protein
VKNKADKDRINEFIEAIIRVAQGDYSIQLELSNENNILDSLAMGLNMMIDDIGKSVEIESQNEKIKQINVELKIAKEKAEESDRLKSAFLANMSHEIRTPMNGILGFASLLKKPGLTCEQQQKFVSIIEESGERMLNIINDLINISKIESGQMGISTSPTSINELIGFIDAFFKPEVEKKGVRITYTCSLPAQDAIVKTDREKLYAILINLVKNAIKFTHAGSIEFGYEKKGNNLEFYVKDTGIGIVESKLNNIFERFVQANDTITRNYGGAGLGLAISKAYVELLNGKMWVESQVGKGSQFYFTIPYKSEAGENEGVAPKTSVASENFPEKRLKVLIVEDDPAADILLTMILEEFVSEIIHAGNGIEAIDACRKNTDIDLVLMDLKMSEMDGYEAVRQIRQFDKDLIIIAQTAYALTGEREKAIEASCNDYITKPINGKDLITIIRKHIKL